MNLQREIVEVNIEILDQEFQDEKTGKYQMKLFLIGVFDGCITLL